MKVIIKIFIEVIKNQVFITVLSGTLVYALSQLLLEGLIIPHKKIKELKERICYTLTYYRCYYSNPLNTLKKAKDLTGKYNEGSTELRKIGAELAGYVGSMSKIHFLKRKKLDSAYRNIIGISNGFYILTDKINIIQENWESEKEIEKNLGIRIG